MTTAGSARTPLLVTNGRIVTPTETFDTGWLRTDGTVISALGSGPVPAHAAANATELDAGRRWVGPGFIDLHIHGGGGHEIMEGREDALAGVSFFLARHGTTAFLPTTYTASREDTLHVLKIIAAQQGSVDGGATVLGAHMEGPYISRRRRGAHRQQYIREADWEELDAFLATGVVRLMAVAPEQPGNAGLVAALRDRGVAVSAGHTDATFEDMLAAADAGVSQVTHVFNGMRGVHHREPGAAGAALLLDQISCELIADGIHVDPAVLRLVRQAKGRRGVILVSDAGKAAGLADGEYIRAGRKMTVRDGAMRMADGTISSSTSTLDVGLRTYCAANDLPFDAAWDSVSRNAAEAIGVADRKGTLEPGKDADVVMLDDDGRVAATIVEGRLVHRTW
ncbi:N-acetylglucosamine-6-phosphate deacetylase [Phytoactinopolyspora mesophila]|uniref:N-acetylglucosamine-6-phosphate deacetylase n=1 Tax=Phytoactinopolyspora mesophila TaxID=2650750 RepID=A0A7K3M2C9_9ACTN|nr:N-acetylglucosamine-6-phosphate deacetylase [Phytoactinopolyspora mesophila]NDL57444.1 N-acetylglucosamine-6-phosphate deacetylase [Phytoactinopolyspora mesophila]